MNKSHRTCLVTLAFVATPWLVAPAGAAPTMPQPMLSTAAGPPLQSVRYYRRGGGGGGGAAIGLGIAGALIGGAIIASQPRGYYGYGYQPGYSGYQPGYYGGPVYAAPAPYIGGDDEVSYCSQRYRSYDPYSGTYLGFDGLRHPCP